jgi:hypothetical protein
MAEGDAAVHNNFKEQMLMKTIDGEGDTFRVALYDVNYTWSPDGADTAYAVTNEVAAAGYGAGGGTVASPAVTQDDTNNLAKWDGENVTWTAMGSAAPRHALLYDDTTTPKWVLIHWELNTDSNGGDYTLQFSGDGIMTVS